MAQYSDPSASVLVNDMPSRESCIFNGTRQGCPLSPILFALIMDPLAQCIRQSQEVSGISVGETTHKIWLYTDDVIMMLTQPVTSLKASQKILKYFGDISYYKE